eukprot:gene7633-9390_t
MILGCGGSGKTSLLYKLILDNYEISEFGVPTMGFNRETYGFKNGVVIEFWDSGGGDQLKPHFAKYHNDIRALVFVINSTDFFKTDDDNLVGIDRTSLSVQFIREELYNCILQYPYLDKIPLLILCNQQDLPSAVSSNEINKKLNLDQILKDRNWKIKETSAKTDTNSIIKSHFQWIADNL